MNSTVIQFSDIKKEKNENMKKRELYLRYNKDEKEALNEIYNFVYKVDDRETREDGCIQKNCFENKSMVVCSTLTGRLIDVIYVYLEKTRIPAYYDSYQENLGIDENEDLVSDTLIYNQLQKLIFKNANNYSYKRKPPFEDYYLNNEVRSMATVLENYFMAIYNIFGAEFLYSSKAFRLMIEIFPSLYDKGLNKKELTYELFYEELEYIKNKSAYENKEFIKNKDYVLDKIFEAIFKS